MKDRVTIRELKQLLNKANIPEDIYDLNGGLPNEAFCINQVNQVW